jgi:lysozyme
MKNPRTTIAALVLSASTLVGIAVHEGYRGDAYTPVAGDVNTIGFGETKGVKLGDKTDPVRALIRLQSSANQYAEAVKRCAPVPMYQYEFSAFVSVTYNIGIGAFCSSTMARKLRAGDYAGACAEILRWDKFQGRVLPGLTKRRQAEYKQCTGGAENV